MADLSPIPVPGFPGIASVASVNASIPRIARPSSIQTWLAPHASGIGTWGLAGYTLSSLIALEGHFDIVRLLYANANTGATWPIANMAIAPTAYVNDGVNPLDTSSAAVSWTQCTTNNSGADGYYPSPTGSNYSLTVAAAASTGLLSWGCTDWMEVSSYQPMDAGQPFPLLMTRCYSAGNQQGPGSYNHLYQPVAIWPTINQGRIIRTFRQASVNGVSTPSNFNAPVEHNYLTPTAVQTYRRGCGYNVMAIGDSLTAGIGSTGNANSWLFQACAIMSKAGMPVNWINHGWSGQTTAQFFSRGMTAVPLFRPDVCVIATCSPNDSATTTAQFNLMLARAMALQDTVRRAGGIPVLKTAGPFYGYTTTSDPMRVAINNTLRGLAKAGNILLLDDDAIVSDGATPQAAILPQYYDPATQHLNDAADYAIAQALVSILYKALVT